MVSGAHASEELPFTLCTLSLAVGIQFTLSKGSISMSAGLELLLRLRVEVKSLTTSGPVPCSTDQLQTRPTVDFLRD